MAEGRGRTRRQVVVIGAGPAGMLLGHMLRQQGIDVVVLERRRRVHVEGRVRAGVLERGTVALLARLGLDGRLRQEGLVHEGVVLSVDGDAFRIDFAALTGATVTVYGQQEVMRDLFDAAEPRGLEVVFGAEDLRIEAIDTATPRVVYRRDGRDVAVDCDVIAGCDGFHGASRAAIPEGVLKTFERVYPSAGSGSSPTCRRQITS